MKKILTIAVAMLAMAMTASANTVAWGLNTGETLDFDTGTIYLVQGSLPETDGWDTKESFSTSDIGGTIMDSASLVSGGGGGNELIKSVGGATGRFDFFVAAISTDGSQVALSPTTRVNIKDNENNSFVTFDANQFTTYTAAAVPEPTTVALLALGLAALGLKRKVA